jgi:hypothetical protein
MAHITTTKGRHSELLAQTALLANGWTVMESTTPEVFDIGITRPGMGREFYRVQIKSARPRDDRNGEVVVYARKRNGESYTLDEADYFIGILENDVYMFPNRELSEYWCPAHALSEKWTKLEIGIDTLKKEAI